MSYSKSVVEPVNSIETKSQYVKQSVIAVIDDCSLFMSKVGKFLEELDHRILGIDEPMAGMGKLLDEQPQLILLDTQMPTIDGYSVCKFLRSTSSFKDVPIILLTEYDNKSEREYATFIKANDIFCKKSHLDNLVTMIQNHIPSSTTQEDDYSFSKNSLYA
ncbi:response regulator [Geminocystis herdmanii]|uniref:response regulator n=1 Tax=Geminocystis herdmanii TaxID=669359 RepID=UPI000349B78B|nr:response regulator [Geminocystis herdmanii]